MRWWVRIFGLPDREEREQCVLLASGGTAPVSSSGDPGVQILILSTVTAMIFSHYNQETRLTDWLQLTILTAREGSSIISALKECFSSCCSFRSFCLAALWASDLSVGLEIIKERFHTSEIIYFLYSSLLYSDNIIEEHQT